MSVLKAKNFATSQLVEPLIESEWNVSIDRIVQFLLKNGANRHSIREIFRQKMGDSSFEKTAHDLFRGSLWFSWGLQALLYSQTAS